MFHSLDIKSHHNFVVDVGSWSPIAPAILILTHWKFKYKILQAF